MADSAFCPTCVVRPNCGEVVRRVELNDHKQEKHKKGNVCPEERTAGLPTSPLTIARSISCNFSSHPVADYSNGCLSVPSSDLHLPSSEVAKVDWAVLSSSISSQPVVNYANRHTSISYSSSPSSSPEAAKVDRPVLASGVSSQPAVGHANRCASVPYSSSPSSSPEAAKVGQPVLLSSVSSQPLVNFAKKHTSVLSSASSYSPEVAKAGQPVLTSSAGLASPLSSLHEPTAQASHSKRNFATNHDAEIAMAMQLEEDRKPSLTKVYSSSIVQPCPFCRKLFLPSAMRSHKPLCEVDFSSFSKNSASMAITPLSSDSDEEEVVETKSKLPSWLSRPTSSLHNDTVIPSVPSLDEVKTLPKPMAIAHLSPIDTSSDTDSVASDSSQPTTPANSSDCEEKCRLSDFLHVSSKSLNGRAQTQSWPCRSLAVKKSLGEVTGFTSRWRRNQRKRQQRKRKNLSLHDHAAERTELLIKQERLDLVRQPTVQSYKPGNLKGSNDSGSDDEQDEEYGPALTYAEYKPSHLCIGKRHPDPVVETSSLSSVRPPEICYDLQKSFPAEVIDNGHLSALQLEAVAYAAQRHQVIMDNGTRSGFLIGDGAGVGKGRTVAGVIFENFLQGRKKAIWLSVSNDLKVDAERDLRDVCAKDVKVHSLLKLKYTCPKLSKDKAKKEKGEEKADDMNEGVMFGTYMALIGESVVKGKRIRRLDRLVEWCAGRGKAEDFDGVIEVVFDECHKAKNLIASSGSSKATKTGSCVLELQCLLPKARVIYCSATGASEPRHMAYMSRLGIWGEGTQFRDFACFLLAVEKRGVGGMEVVAMDMKLRGMYLARQLSFSGSTFCIVDAPLSDDYKKMYDDSVQLWVLAREKFLEAQQLACLEGQDSKTMWGQFWGAHQRFFKYLCIGAKVPHVVQLTKDALANNKCVVIGLQSTGEARTLDQLDESQGLLDDFVSTARGVFSALVEKQFPIGPKEPRVDGFIQSQPTRTSLRCGTKRVIQQVSLDDDSSSCESENDCLSSVLMAKRLKGSFVSKVAAPSSVRGDTAMAMKCEQDIALRSKRALKDKENQLSYEALPSKVSSPGSKLKEIQQLLLDRLEVLGPRLPLNTLDELIDQLGGTKAVAEMTGRRGRMVSKPDGTAEYEPRTESGVPMDQVNLSEKDCFMRGDKLVAIISEAASSGISMQADRRVKNQRRRVHITIELPWSADRAIQQFGRTHRSNQTSAPEYVFIISDLAGERRFASVVAKRLESLGAITHGDRRATESRDLSRYNFDTKYGRCALEAVLLSAVGLKEPVVPLPNIMFFSDVCRELKGVGVMNEDEQTGQMELNKKADAKNIAKFLNRILGVSVTLQNQLFAYFTDVLDAVIADAKRNGRYDEGILDLAGNPENIEIVKAETFEGMTLNGLIFTELFQVQIERGLTFEAVRHHFNRCSKPFEGFYISNMLPNGKHRVILVISPNGTERCCQIIRPNMGRIIKSENIMAIRAKHTQTWDLARVERLWRSEYETTKTSCIHVLCFGSCRRRLTGEDCRKGCRHVTYHILSGSLLSLWNEVEGIVGEHYPQPQSKIPIMRVRCKDGRTIIGSSIPPICVPKLQEALRFIGEIDHM